MLTTDQQTKAVLLLRRFKDATWNRPSFSCLAVEVDELLGEPEVQGILETEEPTVAPCEQLDIFAD